MCITFISPTFLSCSFSIHYTAGLAAQLTIACPVALLPCTELMYSNAKTSHFFWSRATHSTHFDGQSVGPSITFGGQRVFDEVAYFITVTAHPRAAEVAVCTPILSKITECRTTLLPSYNPRCIRRASCSLARNKAPDMPEIFSSPSATGRRSEDNFPLPSFWARRNVTRQCQLVVTQLRRNP